jgi:pimeloyl-ACP methyl ester carboxylesterase
MQALDAEHLRRVTPKLRELTAPTLIVWGTADNFFDVKWAYWLRDTIPGATRVIEIPGARLFFPEERPEFLAEEIRAFWSGSSGNVPAKATSSEPQRGA